MFGALLARVLPPRDFGLIAMLTVFTGFAVVFIDLGVSVAIVQRPNVEERHLSTQFWLNLCMGSILTLLTIAIAPLLAAFYDEPRLLILTIAIAPSFLLSAVAATQTAILDRSMDFKRLAILETMALAAANVLAIGMATSGFGVWSLVALSLAMSGFRALFLWISCDWRPHRLPDRESLHELIHFGGRFSAYSILSYWARNADNLLIGRFIGPTPLAYYNRAYSLMSLPSDAVATVTTRVMIPAMSRMQDDRERCRRVFLQAMGLISLVMFPIALALLVLSRPFILAVYGPRWAPVIPLLEIFSGVALIQVISRTTGWIFTSQGRVDMLLRWGVISSLTAIMSFFIGLPWGTKGVAVSYLCWNIAMMYPLFTYVGPLIGVTVRDILDAVGRIAVASFVMAGVVWLVERQLPNGLGPWAELAIGIAAGVLTYLAVVFLLSPKPLKEARQMIAEYWRRRGTLDTRDGRTTSASATAATAVVTGNPEP